MRPASLLASLSLALGLGLVASSAPADEPLIEPVGASMGCEHVVQPGRMRCAAEVHVRAHQTIAWADVTILELPDLAAALKGRIGPSDATSHEPTHTSWAFGLIAKKTGQGEARARVRIVVCDPAPGDAGAPRCVPQTFDVKTLLHVGPA